MTKEELIEKFKEKKPTIIKAAKILGFASLLGFLLLLVFILSVRFGAFGKLPSHKQLSEINNHLASEIYSKDGVLLGKYFKENRSHASLEAVSPYVVDALVATEDARFFEHGGIDYMSLFRVFFKTILGGDDSSGGGSTLSQQLAKNLYPRENALPIAKVKEMLIAKRLEKVYSKNEILSLYLNTVSFGEEVFGISVATERYFNSAPDRLKLEEAATLVGMLKATTYYNPKRHPERAKDRRNVVLKQMLTYDKINQSEYDSLQALDFEIDYNLISTNVGLAPYFREHIRSELKEWISQQKKPDGTFYNMYTDGLKIRTTIDSRMQGYAEEAVKTHLTALQKSFDEHWKDGKPWGSDQVIERAKKKTKRYKSLKAAGKSEKEITKSFATPVKMTIFDWEKGEVEKEITPLDSLRYYYCLLNTGFLVAEPQTGEIKAWVGGSTYKYFKYDHVKSKRQVGSTFKPIVYATALQNGYEPCDYFYNRNTIYSDYDDWEPKNSDGVYGGLLSMEGGLMNSVNTITVDIIMRTGTKDVIDLAHQMGITSTIPEVPSIALGTADVSLFEMIQVYGTLANEGVHVKPKYIMRVEDAKGNVIGDFMPQTIEQIENDTTKVLEKDHAQVMTRILRSVVEAGTAQRLRWKYNFENQIAGKTGTTQSQADGWFMGYTPNLVAGAWVGAEDPGVHFRDISLGQGANMALPIWAEFMKRIHADPQLQTLQQDTFPALSEEMAWKMECPTAITDDEYYFMQHQFVAQDKFIIQDENIINTIEEFLNPKPEPEPPNTPKINQRPSAKDLEKARKQLEKERKKAKKKAEQKEKRERRKEKRKKFFNDLFKEN